jgi:hypothetical protein
MSDDNDINVAYWMGGGFTLVAIACQRMEDRLGFAATACIFLVMGMYISYVGRA